MALRHLGAQHLRVQSKARCASARVSDDVSTSVDFDLGDDQSTGCVTPPVLGRPQGIIITLLLAAAGELRQILLVLAVAIAGSLYQTLGIASIMPFIAILADGSLAEGSWLFILLSDVVSAPLQDKLVPAAGSIALFALVISNPLTILDDHLSLRLFQRTAVPVVDAATVSLHGATRWCSVARARRDGDHNLYFAPQ